MIPHTNMQLPWHNFDDKDYEFISTYRRRFKLPEGTEGKRVFVDFEGAMTASTVWINGVRLGEYKGGFTPFSFELTQHLHREWRKCFTGAAGLDRACRYSAVRLRDRLHDLRRNLSRGALAHRSAHVIIDNIFAQPKDVLGNNPSLDVSCFLAGDTAQKRGLSLEVELRDGDQIIAKVTARD